MVTVLFEGHRDRGEAVLSSCASSSAVLYPRVPPAVAGSSQLLVS